MEDVVLAGPEKGRQLIKRAFYVPWKFMLLGGRQRVVADVQHDWPALTLDTRLAEKGFYAGLHTTYSLAPEVPGQSRQSGRTRLTLDFRVTPSVLPPPPFKFVLKSEWCGRARAWWADGQTRASHVPQAYNARKFDPVSP